MVPAALGGLHGVHYAVTGETAGDADFTASVRAHAPIVFAFVLGLAFLLLLVTFRSIVIPIKAIVLNLLSVGAAYGVLVWIFQHGHLQGLLGFHSNGGIVTWLPLFLFSVLFGLSMDYHVFILSRIRELVDRGLSTEEAVERGHPHDRQHGDERRDRDGRRVRDLRDALDARHQADGRRPRRRGAARRDDHPRRAAAGDDEAARRLELVPAPRAALAAEPRARARAAGWRQRGGRIVRRAKDMGRTSIYLLLALPVGAAAAVILVAGWAVCAFLAITPLVVPALVAFRAAVGAVARADAELANALLGTTVRPPIGSPGRPGFWRRGGNVLGDEAFWQQQVHLLQRFALGWALALVELALVAAGAAAIVEPAVYRWTNQDIGSWHVDSLGRALLFVVPGVLALVLAVVLIRPFGAVARSLVVGLLESVAPADPAPVAHTRSMRVRSLAIHAAVFVGLCAFATLIWALTTRGYFWPVWVMLVFALPLAIHAWVELVELRPTVASRQRLTRGLAIHEGVSVGLRAVPRRHLAALGRPRVLLAGLADPRAPRRVRRPRRIRARPGLARRDARRAHREARDEPRPAPSTSRSRAAAHRARPARRRAGAARRARA